MPYATKADIEELYGADALFAADHDGDGVAEDAPVLRAIEEADAEIDSSIGVRYPLPLAETPRILRRLSVDIAIYRLALSRDVLTEELRTRYEDATKTLDAIATGKKSLNLAAPDSGGDDDGPSFEAPRPIVQTGPEREFSREKMRDL